MKYKLKAIFQEKPNVLILGFGKEGRSSYRFIRKHFPHMRLSISDANLSIANDSQLESDKNIKLILGPNYLENISNFDLIIKSPGVKIINVDNELKKKITSQTDLFLQCYSKNIIGVTGTKGKSTTASLIKHILTADNKDAVLIGNIGIPAFDMIEHIDDNTVIVYELSAHQLEYIHSSPYVAIILNIFPEHLDYFDSLDDYTIAKNSIYKYQGQDDILIIQESLTISLSNVKQNIISVSSNVNRFNIISSPLLGKHNLINVYCAIHAVSKFGVDVDVAIQSLCTFESLPHRLEYVGEFCGIKFINDSISTIPESTIAAVEALGSVDTLILGGWDRGLDYTTLVNYLRMSSVSRFIFLGKAGSRMFAMFEKYGSKELFKAETIEKVFKQIICKSPKGGVCLLSPAAASYDQFHNFEHRGDTFKKLAKELISE